MPLIPATARALHIVMVLFLLQAGMWAVPAGAETLSPGIERHLSGPDAKPALGSLPLAAFIQRVFAGTLGFEIVLAPDVQADEEPVNLRLGSAVSRRQLFLIGRRILSARGIAIQFNEGVLFFVRDAARKTPGIPRLPGSSNPYPDQDLFVQVPLRFVGPVKVGVWLAENLASRGFNVDEDTVGNTVLLSGPEDIVAEALRMLEVLDQPRFAARHSLKIVPRHVPADSLARDLVAILQSEGIAAEERSPVSSVMVMPMLTQNVVLVFAARQGLADHAAEWARHIDRPAADTVGSGIFSWPLEHMQADVVVDVLQGLVDTTPPSASAIAASLPPDETADPPPDDGGADSTASASTRRSPQPSRPALAADRNRNAVVFRGPAVEWRRLVAQIRAMDLPVASVLVEVLLVDVRLDRNAGSGLEWLASGSIHGDEVSFGSSGLGLGQDGFNLLLRDGSTVRAALALFAADTRAAIRARPRLVVASGHEARLEVGDEIPVVASSSRSTRRPDAPLVSAVEYRHTGLSLAVRPTVLAGDRVELDVLQELSSARETASSGIDSPTIRSRRLQTTVSLRDGGAVLLGGLQETAGSASRAGAAALPRPATALDAKTRESGRTELMVLIRPRVLRSPEEASALTAGGH